MESTQTPNCISATRVVASTPGVLVGLAAIDHGTFEVLEGNVAPDSLMIFAIGPAQRFSEHGLQPSLIIAPNSLLGGC